MILYAILTALLIVLLFGSLGFIKSSYLGVISPYLGPAIAIIFTILIARVIKKLLKSRFEKATFTLNVDKTRFVVFTNFVQVIIYAIGIIFIIFSVPALRQLSYSMLAGAGVLALIIGFSTQELLSNIVAGIFLAISEPFRVGDLVTVTGEYGTIEDITMRQTVMRTWDNRRIIIPNSNIAKDTIINYSIEDEKILKYIDIGISYDSDIDITRKIIIEEVEKHSDFIPNSSENIMLGGADVKVRVLEFGEFALKIRIYFWVKDNPTGIKMSTEVLEAIKKRFDKEGVEIPFPYRTIVYKKDLKETSKLEE